MACVPSRTQPVAAQAPGWCCAAAHAVVPQKSPWKGFLSSFWQNNGNIRLVPPLSRETEAGADKGN